jgi:hypothetical protein
VNHGWTPANANKKSCGDRLFVFVSEGFDKLPNYQGAKYQGEQHYEQIAEYPKHSQHHGFVSEIFLSKSVSSPVEALA